MAAAAKAPKRQTVVGMSEFEGAEPASDGWHRFVVAEVVDLGEEVSKFKAGETQHRGFLLCQLDEKFGGEGDLADVPKEIRFYFSYDIGFGGSKKGSKLRTMVEQWMGKKLTEGQLDKIRSHGFDLAKFEGRSGLVLTASEQAKTSEAMFAKPVKWAPADDPAAIKAGAPDGVLEVDNFTPYWQREQKKDAATGGGSAKGSSPRGGGSTPFDDDEALSAGGQVEDDDIPF